MPSQLNLCITTSRQNVPLFNKGKFYFGKKGFLYLLISGDFAAPSHNTSFQVLQKKQQDCRWYSAEKVLVPAGALVVPNKPPLILLIKWCK